MSRFYDKRFPEIVISTFMLINFIAYTSGPSKSDLEGINKLNLSSPESTQNSIHNPNTRTITVEKEEIYPNDRRGLMLVINVNEWDNNLQRKREGSERDVESLQETGPLFGYIVHTVNNPNKKEFEKTIEDFANDKRHKEADSAIIIIMSHGGQPAEHINPIFPSHSVDVLARDNKRVSSNWIIKQFSTENCPALAGKPKIIFFGTCRGSDEDYGVLIDYQTDGFPSMVYPQISDVIVVFPSMPGYTSYRSKNDGTRFVQGFIQVLLTNWNYKDLKSILEKVGELLKARQPTTGVFQIISYNDYGFTKKLFFEKMSIEEENRLKQMQTVIDY